VLSTHTVPVSWPRLNPRNGSVTDTAGAQSKLTCVQPVVTSKVWLIAVRYGASALCNRTLARRGLDARIANPTRYVARVNSGPSGWRSCTCHDLPSTAGMSTLADAAPSNMVVVSRVMVAPTSRRRYHGPDPGGGLEAAVGDQVVAGGQGDVVDVDLTDVLGEVEPDERVGDVGGRGVHEFEVIPHWADVQVTGDERRMRGRPRIGSER